MSAVTIRRARLEDHDVLCRLYWEFHEFHARDLSDRVRSLGKLEDQDWTRLRGELTKIIERDDAAIFVAEMDGIIIGLAEVYVRQAEVNPQVVDCAHGYLQSLYVMTTMRRRGLGRQLVAVVEQWLKDKGASEVRLSAWAFVNGPQFFYERIGYRVLKVEMARSL